MAFLSDLIYYNSGNECPEPFITWSGLATLGAVMGKKVWTMHGSYFRIYPNLYVTMVGTAGSGKSTAQDMMREIIVDHFPNLLFSDDFQSAQDILKKMSDDENVLTWKDELGLLGDPGVIQSYRPFYALVDELSNFMSVDMKAMTGLLVGIYQRASFGTGFKNDVNKKQRFRNPYFSMLACTVPDWMMNNMRMDLFTGGLGRRMIIVHAQKKKQEPNPFRVPDHAMLHKRIVDHLKAVAGEGFYGCLTRTKEADAWWTKWYCDPKRFNREDPILIQFHETKQIPVLKVATLLALCDQPFKFEIDVHHLQGAVLMLDNLEPDVLKLTQGIGRNELAGIGAQIVDFLNRSGGAASESHTKKFFTRYANSKEFTEVINNLLSTEVVYCVQHPDHKTGVPIPVLMTANFYPGYMAQKNGKTFVSGVARAHDVVQELIASQDGPVASLPAGTEMPTNPQDAEFDVRTVHEPPPS